MRYACEGDLPGRIAGGSGVSTGTIGGGLGRVPASGAGLGSATSAGGDSSYHSRSWVDTAIEQVNRIGPDELIHGVLLPRLHGERGARAVRDLQFVDGDVSRA